MPYSYKLMSAADGGDVLEEHELPDAKDRRDAEDLATQAYETARFQAASNNPPLAFPRAVILMDGDSVIWRATEADLRNSEHDMDV
ncbi:hypothetical protein MKL09_26640 [Methylobacterium sp. J-048]|uniref:hypothetical protein n=1 Tax=Methylobacterium sp. J-048 TaxID=2836635 RepID=UPI001FBBA38B|nr:hypothetical protein [Methylobacterium sp. J-048]MCJ2060096.1 hypothetical protein [Methylobacterium sp. J-048]